MTKVEVHHKKNNIMPKKNSESKNRVLQKFLKQRWGDNWTYEGELKNNLPNGFGKLSSSNSEWVFEGEFKNGLLNGLGKHFLNGTIIKEGNFIDNVLNGLGIEYNIHAQQTIDGSIIRKTTKDKEGFYIDGELNGFGTKYLIDGVEIYEQGEFENGLLHGIGKRNLIFLHKFEEGLFINGIFQGK